MAVLGMSWNKFYGGDFMQEKVIEYQSSERIYDKDRVYRIIKDAYDSGDPSKYPNQSAISAQVLREKNKEINPEWEPTEKFQNKGFLTSCQSSVSKQLKALMDEKKVLKLETNVYVPYTSEFLRDNIKKRIIDSISFNRRNVFVFSSSRYTVGNDENDINVAYSLLLDIRFDHIALAKELFKQYIGDKNIYDILEFYGKLLVMIEGKENAVEQLKKDIFKIVEEAYDVEYT